MIYETNNYLIQREIKIYVHEWVKWFIFGWVYLFQFVEYLFSLTFIFSSAIFIEINWFCMERLRKISEKV